MTAFEQALSLHRMGNVAGAEALYRQILKSDNSDFGALYMLGTICAQRNQFDEAERLLRTALSVDQSKAPSHHAYGTVLCHLERYDDAIHSFDKALELARNNPAVFLDRGFAQMKLERFQEAVDSYERALKLDQHSASAHYNRGVALEKLNRREEALTSYDRALLHSPQNASAHCNRSVLLYELRRYQEALTSCDRALELDPTLVQAHRNRGGILYGLKRYREALASCDRALALDPNLTQAHCNRGDVLDSLKRYPEALASYDRALTLDPDLAQAHCNRAATLSKLKRYQEALASCDQALALESNLAQAHCNRGSILNKLKLYSEALASHDRALAIKPDFAQAHCNRGNVLQNMKRFDEALASCEMALVAQPDFADAHFLESQLRLLLGDFANGWPKYEWRWKSETNESPIRNFAQSLWLGTEPMEGKTILFHSEQGLGDSIQFCRYVPLAAKHAAHVILEVEQSLVELMRKLSGVGAVVAKGDPLPDFQAQCPLASLPLAFGTRLETIPADVPYLTAPKAHLEKWQRKLGRSSTARVAVNWAGNPNFANDDDRSIGLSSMSPLFTFLDAQFFCIQKNPSAKDKELLKTFSHVTDLSTEIETFSDTAAIISLMDVVVSSDTSIVHLAGALGAPVWTLLSYVPDWRWLLGRQDSPWYPTMRLFRQPEPGDWRSVITSVRDALGSIDRRKIESQAC
jgi:tetratricopeptide (TPR) repeat protein